MATSLSFETYNRTKEVIRNLADAGKLAQVGQDDISPIRGDSVVGRFARKQRLDLDTEGSIALPGVIVTYMGWSSGVDVGTFHQDDGVIRLSVQVVDYSESNSDRHAADYLTWTNRIRERLQRNPYTTIDDPLGHVYLVHVAEQHPPAEDQWVMFNETRSHLNVLCFTRTRRDDTQEPWAT